MRVHEDFRIVALGLPVPHYPGSSLDPPLRSRFQALHVNHPQYQVYTNTHVSVCEYVSMCMCECVCVSVYV